MYERSEEVKEWVTWRFGGPPRIDVVLQGRLAGKPSEELIEVLTNEEVDDDLGRAMVWMLEHRGVAEQAILMAVKKQKAVKQET